MDGNRSPAPSPERARTNTWGGPEAWAELHRIADDARLRAGFRFSAIEVMRGDGLLELVALAGVPDHEAGRGDSFSLSHVHRVLKEGTRYGKFVFLAEEDMDAELQDAIRGYGYVPSLPESSDPERWRALDMLVAYLVDGSGRTRALLHLDEPLTGRRPRPREMQEMADSLDLALQAVLATVDREELTRQARLDETARTVVRAASRRLSGRDLLDVVLAGAGRRIPRPDGRGVAARPARPPTGRAGRRRHAAGRAAPRHRGGGQPGLALPDGDRRGPGPGVG